MKTLFIDQKFTYDGTQLRSLYGYLEHKVQGPSVVSWIGPCHISFDHMVDGEDLLEQAQIQGDEMLHFIVEIFDQNLFSGVLLQRLFAGIAKAYLQKISGVLGQGLVLVRDGDDIYLGDRKLSISIASKSPVSVMIHFAMNVVNEGTPVKTLSLSDLKLDPKKTAMDLMHLLAHEVNEITNATYKVRALS